MALTQVYTAIPGDVITAARWNNEFGNIYNNGTQVSFPVTTDVSFAGKNITLDSAGATIINSSSVTALSFTPGAKSGATGTVGNVFNVVANTTTNTVTAPSGTAAAFTATSFQQPTLAAASASVVTTDAATLYIANAPAAGTNQTITNPYALWVDAGNVRFDGNIVVGGTALFSTTLQVTSDVTTSGNIVGTIVHGGHIQGLTYAYSPGADPDNDVLINVGEATSDNTNPVDRRLIRLTTAITKRIDATWAVGDGNGGLDTGGVSNTAYFIWLIQRSDTGVVDVLFSLSATAPTMPTNYSFKRLIGWVKRSGGGNILFLTYELSGGGLDFVWRTLTLDIDLAATLTTSQRTDAVKVPLAFSVDAHLAFLIDDAATSLMRAFTSTDGSGTPSTTAAPGFTFRTVVAGQVNGGSTWIRTTAAGLITSEANVATYDQYRVITLGFKWSRR